ncbi:MAG: dockerin type I repeat-containing protein [Clostridia bacterium]|nr:dockerin type I repeat-containing protein [Clostridia bacterium]
MKKLLVKITVWLLCVILFSVGVIAQTTGVSLSVIKATVTDTTMSVTCRVSSQVDDITYLVYTVNEQDKEDVLVQAGQTAGGTDRVLTFSLVVPSGEEAYRLLVGGSGVQTPRRVTVTAQGYRSENLGFIPGQTAGEMKAVLQGLQTLSVARNGKALDDTQEVLTGDVLLAVDATGQEVSFTLVTYGDVNGDGKIDASDALQILRHTVQKTTLTGPSFAAANWVQDGGIDATDALSILKFAVRKIDSL